MHEDHNRVTSAIADMESNVSDAPLAKEGSQAQDTRVNIVVRSYRRLHGDPDGISAKAAIDGLVARGLLADDSSKQIASITFETIKSKEEKTIIEIIYNK